MLCPCSCQSWEWQRTEAASGVQSVLHFRRLAVGHRQHPDIAPDSQPAAPLLRHVVHLPRQARIQPLLGRSPHRRLRRSSFRHPFYGTYAHPLNGANYERGANFAYAGATANATAPITPFHLNLQVDNFLNFQSKALDTGSYSPNPKGPYRPVNDAFSRGAYFIPEIGGNDFTVTSVNLGLPPLFVINNFVPAAAAAVKTAITTLHDSGGARLFFVGNTPPLGCSPVVLTRFDSLPKDSLNCVDEINSIHRAYGAALQVVVDEFQTSFAGDGTKIYYMDNYKAGIEIYTNPGTYGFTNTLQACCGSGGPYNYGSASTCCFALGSCCPDLTPCSTPESYVNWDGGHYTQAFYRHIAKFFLTGRFVTPALNLTAECDLDFSKFDRNS